MSADEVQTLPGPVAPQSSPSPYQRPPLSIARANVLTHRIHVSSTEYPTPPRNRAQKINYR